MQRFERIGFAALEAVVTSVDILFHAAGIVQRSSDCPGIETGRYVRHRVMVDWKTTYSIFMRLKMCRDLGAEYTYTMVVYSDQFQVETTLLHEVEFVG